MVGIIAFLMCKTSEAWRHRGDGHMDMQLLFPLLRHGECHYKTTHKCLEWQRRWLMLVLTFPLLREVQLCLFYLFTLSILFRDLQLMKVSG